MWLKKCFCIKTFRGLCSFLMFFADWLCFWRPRSIRSSSPQRSVLVSAPVHHLSMRAEVQESSASENIPVDKPDDICLICQHWHTGSKWRGNISGEISNFRLQHELKADSPHDHSTMISSRQPQLPQDHNLPDFIVKSGNLRNNVLSFVLSVCSGRQLLQHPWALAAHYREEARGAEENNL